MVSVRLGLGFTQIHINFSLSIAGAVLGGMWILTLIRLKSSDTINSQSLNQKLIHTQVEMFPTGLIAVDKDLKILAANKIAATYFEYLPNELTGQPLSILLPPNSSPNHNQLAHHYFEHPVSNKAMSGKRIVRGLTKHGELIELEIQLYHQLVNHQAIAFACINYVSEAQARQLVATKKLNRLTRAMDASDDGFWEWNPYTGSVWFNAAFLKMTGQQNVKQASWTGWQAHIHPEEKEAVKAALNEQLEKNNRFDIEYRGLAAEGHWQWMRIKGVKNYDEKGHPRLGGTLTNVNANKRTEKTLTEKSRFLSEVLNRSLCGIYIYNFGEHCNTFINAQYTQITGYDMNDLLRFREAGTFTDLFHPDDAQAALQHFRKIMESLQDNSYAIEFRFKHKAGHWIWCYAKDSVYSRNADGTPKEMLGTFCDMTELKKQGEHIAQLARDYASIFEGSAIGMAQLNLEGAIDHPNQKFCQILQSSEAHLQHSLLTAYCTEDSRNAIAVALQQLHTQQITHFCAEHALVTHAQKIVWVNITLALGTDARQQPSHFIVMIEDINQRKEIEQNLEESNASLERFAYSASHDLQEPLRKIIAFAKVLEQRLANTLKDKDANYELERIVDASSRMSDLIKSLLELSRYSKHKITKQKLSFSELLTMAKQDLERRIEETGAQIQLADDFELQIDPMAMAHLLNNILSNSMLYAKPNVPPKITITHSYDGHLHTINIHDNGRGIAEDKLERMFEPFARFADRGTPGYGMGLAICKQVVNAHGGKIYGQCTPGDGLTLHIEIPEE